MSSSSSTSRPGPSKAETAPFSSGNTPSEGWRCDKVALSMQSDATSMSTSAARSIVTVWISCSKVVAPMMARTAACTRDWPRHVGAGQRDQLCLIVGQTGQPFLQALHHEALQVEYALALLARRRCDDRQEIGPSSQEVGVGTQESCHGILTGQRLGRAVGALLLRCFVLAVGTLHALHASDTRPCQTALSLPPPICLRSGRRTPTPIQAPAWRCCCLCRWPVALIIWSRTAWRWNPETWSWCRSGDISSQGWFGARGTETCRRSG